MVIRIGVTGGIGSGKSTVVKTFDTLGVATISADQIARELTMYGKSAYKEIIECFGDSIRQKKTLEINRSKLADIVYSDESRLRILEEILHPKIKKDIEKKLSHITSTYCICEIPLLRSKPKFIEIDRTILVAASKKIRAKRVSSNRKNNIMQINNIIEIQERGVCSSFVFQDYINNDRNLTDIIESTRNLFVKYEFLFNQD